MNCNDHHFPMENNPWSSHTGDLSNALDPITILTDADLQNELDLYATTQFTFDGLPNMPIKDKPVIMTDHFNLHPSFPSHHRPPNLVINTANNDPCSSTISSPYDPQQHYLTPISSLPASPTLNDLGDLQQMNNPLLSLMASPTLHQHPSSFIQEHDTHYMNRSASIDNTIPSNDLCGTVPTVLKKRPAARRRNGGPPLPRGRPRRQPQPQQQQQRDHQDPSQHPPVDDDYSSTFECLATDVDHNNVNTDGEWTRADNHGITTTTEEQPSHSEARLSKRQRNTAASARFRIKKKMREQCLQRTACEMTNKANFMENKVHELEREIKWLKALLVTKNSCSYC